MRPSVAAIAPRAAFKLIEIDDKHHLLKPGANVVDLGAAPGGWSQLAAQRSTDGGEGAGDRRRPGRHGADLRRDPARPRHDRSRGAGPHPRGPGWTESRYRAVGHACLVDGPQIDRPSAQHGPGRGRARSRRGCAGARRHVPRQGVPGRGQPGAGRAPQPLLCQGPPRQAEGEPRRLGRDVCVGHRLPRWIGPRPRIRCRLCRGRRPPCIP